MSMHFQHADPHGAMNFADSDDRVHSTRAAGNYDTYVETRQELEKAQMQRYDWEQDQIAHMKDFIARWVRALDTL